MKKFCALALVVLLTLLSVPAGVFAQTPVVVQTTRSAGNTQVSTPDRLIGSSNVVTPPRVTTPTVSASVPSPAVTSPSRSVPQPVDLQVAPKEVFLKAGQSQQFQATLTFSDGSVKDVTRNAVFVISNRTVAAVRNGQVIALGPGTATIQVRSYGKTAVIAVTVQKPDLPKVEIPVPVGLTVEPAGMSLKVGESQQFKATVKFSDGTVRDATSNAVFVVSNKNVLNISGGRITALSPGTASVEIRSYGQTARISVEVVKPETAIPKPVNLTVTPNKVTLASGQSQEVRATVAFSDGSTRDVSQNAVWIVSDRRIAAVSNGKITALAPGATTIIMRTYGLTAAINVTVSQAQSPKPVKIAVEPQGLSLKTGETRQVLASVTLSDGTVKDVTTSAEWSVANGRIASVNGGKITALAPGLTTVTVKSGGLAASVSVEVKDEPLAEKRTLRWQYEGKTYTLDVSVPKSLIDWSRSVKETAEKFYGSDGLTQQKMLSTMSSEVRELVLAESASAQGNLLPWVNERQNLQYLSGLAGEVRKVAAGYSRFQTAELALKMVQSLTYKIDAHQQLPVQTLLENGDCSDLSVLLAALLKEMGYDAALLYYSPTSTGNGEGHMAVGIAFASGEVPKRDYPVLYYEYNGKKYYTAETTNKNALIGQRIGYTITRIYPVN